MSFEQNKSIKNLPQRLSNQIQLTRQTHRINKCQSRGVWPGLVGLQADYWRPNNSRHNTWWATLIRCRRWPRWCAIFCLPRSDWAAASCCWQCGCLSFAAWNSTRWSSMSARRARSATCRGYCSTDSARVWHACLKHLWIKASLNLGKQSRRCFCLSLFKIIFVLSKI